MWSVILLVACAQPPVVDPDPVVPFEVDPVEAELSREEVDAALLATVDDLLLAPDLLEWVDPVLLDIEGRGGACPPAREGTSWAYGFAGSCFGEVWNVEGDLQVSMSAESDSGLLVLEAGAVLSIRATRLADGEALLAAGSFHITAQDNGPTVDLRFNQGGVYRDTSDSLIGTELDTGLVVAGVYTRSGGVDAEGFTGTVAGGIEGEEVSVLIEGLIFEAGTNGPTGTLFVRDPSQAWWTLSLADGCGVLSWYGRPLRGSCAGRVLQNVLEARIANFIEDLP